MSAPVTPTTKQVADNIVAQIEAQISQSVPFLPKTFIRVLARAVAGVYVVLYKYGGFIFLQMFVSTASDKQTTVNGRIITPLREWGDLVGIPAPKAATQAELEVTVTVTNQTGFLLSGAQLLGQTNGVTYLVSGDVALNAPQVTAIVRAAGDQQGGDGAGTIGNLDSGAIVAFANPLPNVAREAVVASQVTTGADGETTESYRRRILDRFQKRPQGGAYADYEQWGEEAAGVANVYPYTSDCPGQVDVYVESATEPDGIPTEAQLQDVLDLINLDQNGLATRRPATALVNTFPITRSAFDVQVAGISVPGSLADVQEQITEATTEYFLTRAPYIVGLDVGNRVDIISQAELGGVVSGIVSAAGGFFSSVTVTKAGVPTSLYVLGIGEKAKLGAISYV
ncbi:tail protein [Shewanella phage SFCi1]|nr:tail protein [Shewanella phage SFCi1]